MDKMGVEIRIDMRKIDMSKVYKGAKGDYLTMTTFISPNELGQYDDHGMVTMKTEKNSEERGAILGNAKVFWTDDNSHAKPSRGDGQTHQSNSNNSRQPPNQAPDFDDD